MPGYQTGGSTFVNQVRHHRAQVLDPVARCYMHFKSMAVNKSQFISGFNCRYVGIWYQAYRRHGVTIRNLGRITDGFSCISRMAYVLFTTCKCENNECNYRRSDKTKFRCFHEFENLVEVNN